MSHKANPAVIGSFVLGAMILAVFSVLFFGSTHLFTRTENFVVFFNESVNGLDIGAAVKFNGVPIGEVSQIHLSFDPEGKQTEIPVILTINVGRLYNALGFPKDRDFKLVCEQAVHHGLRARLQYQSFVTGLLFVDLQYIPNSIDQTINIPNHTGYPSIPAASSGLGEVWKSISSTLENISKIDFLALANEAQSLLKTLNENVAQIQFKTINDELISTLSDLKQFVGMPELHEAIFSLNIILDKMKHRLSPLADDLQLTLAEAREALRHVESSFCTLDSFLDPNAAFQQDTQAALQAVTQASEAVKELAQTIEQNPSVLLLGKP